MCCNTAVGISRAGNKALDTGMKRLYKRWVFTQLNQVVVKLLLERRTDEFIFQIALEKQRADCKKTAEQCAK